MTMLDEKTSIYVTRTTGADAAFSSSMELGASEPGMPDSIGHLQERIVHLLSSDAALGRYEPTTGHFMDQEIDRVGAWAKAHPESDPILETTLSAAKGFLNELFLHTLRAGEPWEFPDVSTDQSGAIVLQWGIGRRRSLTVYVEGYGFSYLESWGTSIVNEMADGVIESMAVALGLWRRLHERDGHGSN